LVSKSAVIGIIVLNYSKSRNAQTGVFHAESALAFLILTVLPRLVLSCSQFDLSYREWLRVGPFDATATGR
jgi:hypothetical protein